MSAAAAAEAQVVEEGAEDEEREDSKRAARAACCNSARSGARSRARGRTAVPVKHKRSSTLNAQSVLCVQVTYVLYSISDQVAYGYGTLV